MLVKRKHLAIRRVAEGMSRSPSAVADEDAEESGPFGEGWDAQAEGAASGDGTATEL